MGGRVFSPELGRFLSADPYVAYPDSGLGWNRYAYTHNNPLRYTDPSGYWWLNDVIDEVGDFFENTFDAIFDVVDVVYEPLSELADYLNLEDFIDYGYVEFEVASFDYDFSGPPVGSFVEAVEFGVDLVVDTLLKVWTLPNTVVGLTAGVLGYGAGWVAYGLGMVDVPPNVSITNNAIWFENFPSGAGAITIGNAVISSQGWGPDASRSAYGVIQPIGPHEQAHTYQYQAFGPFFAVAYLLSRGAFTHDSPFEIAATNFAIGEGGWWPW